MYPDAAPFGLLGWQVAFLSLGIPGLLLAAWVFTLREPPRGLSDDVIKPAEGRAWSRFLTDVSSVAPPFTIYHAFRGGPKALTSNLIALAIAVVGAWIAIKLSGDVMQWCTIGFGYYAAFSAAQSLRINDRPTFALTWGTPTFVLAMIGFGAVSAINVIMGFWSAPLALRHFDIDKSTVGLTMGGIQAAFGFTGALIGGRLSDFLLKFTPKGRIWVGVVSSTIPAFFIVGMCNTTSPTLYFLLFCPVALIGNAWIAAGAATIQELVLPRMRGTATTIYFLFSTMIGSGLGPYVVGKISMIQGSLAVGILWGLLASPLAIISLWMCAKNLQKAEASKWDRAAAAGEVL
jgi:MFS family permease